VIQRPKRPRLDRVEAAKSITRSFAKRFKRADDRAPSVPEDQRIRVALATPMAIGTRLRHPAHGFGQLELIDANEPRKKPYKVRFDRGESHHYDVASLKKMEVVGDDGKLVPIELVVLRAADASDLLADMSVLRPHVSVCLADAASAQGSAAGGTADTLQADHELAELQLALISWLASRPRL